MAARIIITVVNAYIIYADRLFVLEVLEIYIIYILIIESTNASYIPSKVYTTS
jgi:hypothetical protein